MQKRQNFETSLKKGAIGEQIIQKMLEDKGWIVYTPFKKDKAHYFDMLATYEKARVIAIDVKTKARLNKWPAQGIDINTYNQYMAFVNSSKVPFFLCFIDDKVGDIHACNIEKLVNPIHINNRTIAWSLSQMKLIGNIGNDKINELSEYDQRNYTYNPL